MAKWMWFRPSGGLPASSSTATIEGRELRGPRWKAHSASSPREGGGSVDGYPIALPRGKPYSSSFLWGGTESMFAELGFRPLGSLGTSKRVMVVRKVVRA